MARILARDQCPEILSIDLLGVIPESQSVLSASNAGIPVIMDEESDAGRAYRDAVARLLDPQHLAVDPDLPRARTPVTRRSPERRKSAPA